MLLRNKRLRSAREKQVSDRGIYHRMIKVTKFVIQGRRLFANRYMFDYALSSANLSDAALCRANKECRKLDIGQSALEEQ